MRTSKNLNASRAFRALGVAGVFLAGMGCGEDHPVESANRPPTITAPATEQVSEGQPLQITPQVADPDDDALKLSAAPMPAPNATFDPQSGVFTWTPEYNAARADPYVVTFTADDGRQSTQVTTSITVVDVNRPPVLIVPPAKSVLAGDLLSFNVTATDPDTEDTVTIVALDAPDGASFDGHAFTWTPSGSQRGVHLVSFLANDNHALSAALTASDGTLILVSEGCLNNDQCRADQVCVANVCGSCTATNQCDPGQACVAGACGPCSNNDQCAGNQHCVGGVCGGCSDNSDCDAEEACVVGVCGSCSRASQCDPGEGCVAGECGGCTDNSDCIPGQVCPFGICGACTAASQCKAGQGCVSGLCGTCTSGSQCRTGEGCVAGTCGQCTDRIQCAPGLACVSNTCQACTPGQCDGQACVQGVCAPCTDNTDCSAGQACRSGACGACLDNTDCHAGQACVSGSCGACASASQCATGQGCVAGSCGDCVNNSHCNSDDVCTGGVCRECGSNQDCAAGKVCLSGFCSACTASSQCSAGQACVDQKCGPCATNPQCPGGQSCYGGVCSAASPSCRAIHDANTSLPDGPYLIAEDGQTITEYCDMTRDGGGWTRCSSWIGVKNGPAGIYGGEVLNYNSPNQGPGITLSDLTQSCDRDAGTVDYRMMLYISNELWGSTRFQAGRKLFSGTGQYTFPAVPSYPPLPFDTGLAYWHYNGSSSSWSPPTAQYTFGPHAVFNSSEDRVDGSGTGGGRYSHVQVRCTGVLNDSWTSFYASNHPACASPTSVKLSLWFRGACASPPCSCTTSDQCLIGQACTGGVCAACTSDAQCGAGKACYGGICDNVLATCQAVHQKHPGLPDGPYSINLSGSTTFTAFCDMTHDAGGWTRCLSWEAESSSFLFYRRTLDHGAGRVAGSALLRTDLQQNCNRASSLVDYRMTTYLDSALSSSTVFQAGPNPFSNIAQQTYTALSNSGPVSLSTWYYNGRTDSQWQNHNCGALFSLSTENYADTNACGVQAYTLLRVAGNAANKAQFSSGTWSSSGTPNPTSLALTLWFRQ